ncbi:hypothetical protein RB25_25360 [Herbaspirillum rubrisubalbicans]|nr:hypothetical protein RB25_25360 [Herbaspirillum rubrisubalbicans]
MCGSSLPLACDEHLTSWFLRHHLLLGDDGLLIHRYPRQEQLRHVFSENSLGLIYGDARARAAYIAKKNEFLFADFATIVDFSSMKMKYNNLFHSCFARV